MLLIIFRHLFCVNVIDLYSSGPSCISPICVSVCIILLLWRAPAVVFWPCLPAVLLSLWYMYMWYVQAHTQGGSRGFGRTPFFLSLLTLFSGQYLCNCEHDHSTAYFSRSPQARDCSTCASSETGSFCSRKRTTSSSFGHSKSKSLRRDAGLIVKYVKNEIMVKIRLWKIKIPFSIWGAVPPRPPALSFIEPHLQISCVCPWCVYYNIQATAGFWQFWVCVL